jgi:predicted glycosyltransferase involved in capsule biosynthesis
MITAVYSCMNRENNLCQSLASWINVLEITEIIIVDWSSKNPLIKNILLKKYLNDKIKIIRVENQQYFSLSKSYNLGISYASNNIIIKLDSDYKNIDHSWLKYLPLNNFNLLKDCFITGHWKFGGKSLSGLLLINKKDFVGYNENIQNWGYEDFDLYTRLQPKLQQIIFFLIKKHIEHIPHPDEERVANYIIKNTKTSLKQNKEISAQNQSLNFAQYVTLFESPNYIIVQEYMDKYDTNED